MLNMAKLLMTKTGLTGFMDTLLSTTYQFFSNDYTFNTENGFRSQPGTYAYSEEEQELELLRKGDRVKHQFPGYLYPRPDYGYVRFVGYLEPGGELMAGIEFANYICRYGMAGSLNGVTYFKCDHGRGAFIPVNTILEENPEFLQKRGENRFLKLGVRVKYQFPDRSHRGAETGTIRYIGRPSASGELMAGIEFDNYIEYGRYGIPIKVNGRDLFECQAGHGALISVNTILEENSEFLRTGEAQFLKVGVKVKYKIPNRLYGGPEIGTIRYIGYPEANGELMAGIEFGTCVGQGRYGAKNGYKAVIPVKKILENNPEFQINMEQFQQYSENSLGDCLSSLPNRSLDSEVNEKKGNSDGAKISNTSIKPLNTVTGQNLEGTPEMQQNGRASKAEMLKLGCSVLFLPNKNADGISGVVQWVGDLDGATHVGIEFEKPVGPSSPLLKRHAQLFTCKERHGILRPIRRIMSNRQLKILGCGVHDSTIRSIKQGFDLTNQTEFICPSICLDDFMNYRGNKGIQGRTNSCYLDSTLFSMFGFTQIFDSCLLENNIGSKTVTDMAEQTQILLGKYIVNPLRTQYFCPAEAILKLRELMLPLNSKLESSYMDAEEFMFLLFEKVFKLQGFLTYDNGVSDFLHQIDNSDLKSRVRIVSTQRLLEVSMKSLGMKFLAAPNPALILEMPRSGGKLVGRLQAVIPTLTLDLSNLTQGGQRKCWICYQDATSECLDCFDTTHKSGMESTSYCKDCYLRSHLHPQRIGHQNRRSIRGGESVKQEADLVAIICVAVCHFVSFARAGSGAWVFCDSNPSGKFPMTEVLPGFDDLLKDITSASEADLVRKWDSIDPYLRRMLTDSHICIYSPRIIEDSTQTSDFETSL